MPLCCHLETNTSLWLRCRLWWVTEGAGRVQTNVQKGGLVFRDITNDQREREREIWIYLWRELDFSDQKSWSGSVHPVDEGGGTLCTTLCLCIIRGVVLGYASPELLLCLYVWSKCWNGDHKFKKSKNKSKKVFFNLVSTNTKTYLWTMEMHSYSFFFNQLLNWLTLLSIHIDL